jgi:hypothetical protein
MPDLQTQLRQYARELDERYPDIEFEELLERIAPTRPRRFTTMRGPAVALAAAVVVLLVIGGVSLLIGGTNEVDPVDEPTTGTFTWEHVAPDSDEAMIGEIVPAVIVGNGDVYLATDDFTDESGMTWTSNDGVEWTEGTAGLAAVPGVSEGFLAYHGGYDGPGGLGFWRSDDGRTWSDAPTSADGTTVAHFTWSAVTVDEVLAMQLPPLPSSHLHEAGTVFKVNDRFVAYYWSSTESVEVAVSGDGQTWESVVVPDFLAEWFDFDSPRAMSDRGFSHRLWSGSFSAGHGTVLAITADGEGHHLWQSSDGVSWEDTGSTLPDHLMGATVHATHHLTAMTIGWSLTPWDLRGATVAYHSVDGQAWQPLAPARSAMIRSTDDKIFFFLDQPGGGVDIATLEE